MTASNPKIAFFDFTSCEGCQLTVVDSLQTYPELLDVVEIVQFREAISEQADSYDIAFIEGSCTRPSDEPRLRTIRERAGLVIALGACAHLGGINSIRNRQALDDVRCAVYGEQADWYETGPVRSIGDVIPIDGVIPGCPINREEFVRTVKLLLQGRQPQLPDAPVCVECRLRETVCLYQKNQACLGPVIRAGCGAICPAYGSGCEGCRGLIPRPNLAALNTVLAEHGLTSDDMMAKMTLFLTGQMQELESEPAHHD